MGTLRAVTWAALAHVTLAKFSVLHFNGKSSVVGRIDPIISPGEVSQHVHGVNGGSNFGYTVGSQDAMMNSKCTSSAIAADKSAYWAPYLYFQDLENPDNFESVEVYYMNVYYFYDDDTQPFPPGLRIVAGNPFLRNPPANSKGDLNWDAAKGDIQPAQINCPYTDDFYPAGSDGKSGTGLPDSFGGSKGAGFGDKYCNGQYSPMQLSIHFPYCYDTSAALDDYKNNMKYPMNAGSATECSGYGPTWIKVPHLFYEIYHDTQPFNSKWTEGQGKSPWRLAQGDPTGYGMHGDFIAGWDTEALKAVIANCDRTPVNGVFVDESMSMCDVPGGLNTEECPCTVEISITETVSGTMTALPGNNPIGTWGVDDTRGSTAPTSTTPASTSPTASSYTTPTSTTPVSTSSSPVVPTSPSGSSPSPAPTSSSYSAPSTSAPVQTSPGAPLFSPTIRPTVTSTITSTMIIPTSSEEEECTCDDEEPTGTGGMGGDQAPITIATTVVETLTVWETVSCPAAGATSCVSVGESGPFTSGEGPSPASSSNSAPGMNSAASTPVMSPTGAAGNGTGGSAVGEKNSSAPIIDHKALRKEKQEKKQEQKKKKQEKKKKKQERRHLWRHLNGES